MLDDTLKQQLKAYLERVTQPIEIVAALDGSAHSQELKTFLQEIEALSDKISYVENADAQRKPSFAIVRKGTDISVHFAAMPMGHEFTSLILALLQVGGYPIKLDNETIEQIKNLPGDYHFTTYMSLTCQNCPDVVQALNMMSIINPRITHEAVDGGWFRDEVEGLKIMAVPTVFMNGQQFEQGRTSVEEILNKLDSSVGEKKAAELNEKAPFDVLIVGGGPAGSAAAIYSARKGIRTGVVAERFGGQVLDTMAIENFISVPETTGPQFGAALEEHVKSYGVDIMNVQRVKEIVKGDLFEVKLESGATLKSKAVIVSTGARWRQIGVPGEKEYMAKGVAYCPHCDGPLFKGKRVAVIGGGNSGVEAAIDLAGVVDFVTLIEYGDKLRADEILQKKLFSMKNIKVIKHAQTSEITGDGEKVNGLSYVDRQTGNNEHIELAGVFVQIGLVPNTEWLKGTVDLTDRGEIKIDSKGQTSVPGLFAAGDVTTVPYKQIVIAIGEGAKASLAAFDYLIRQ